MLSFNLTDTFVEDYVNRTVPWGYMDKAGNSLGEVTFLRTYSRLKEDGTKERWHEVVRRVIEGMFSILKNHMDSQRLPWSEDEMQALAEDAYDRLFYLKWSPPGRGLWVMGTPLVNRLGNSAPLQNCAFVSTDEMTAEDPSGPFKFLMEASMLGVGVGFDTKGADKGLLIQDPSVGPQSTYVIPDTREGWVESVGLIIKSYLTPGHGTQLFDYSKIRPEGAPIRTFGGTAAGPAPLERVHETIREIFDGRAGEKLSTVDIADIGNLIGVCVVAGNVRRSAEILLGSLDDDEFLNLKNPERFPRRNSYDAAAPGWAWMSNNSVAVSMDDNLAPIVEGVVRNGEPGVVWLDTARNYGRTGDAPDYADHRVMGFNPCGEQPLESYECCTLVETFPSRAESLDDFLATLKIAFLYGKVVTLLPTHWEKTNAVMQRNRRVGTSMSGISDFADNNGIEETAKWMDEGYTAIQTFDKDFSEWLTVRESIRTTTVKPSGTVSILAGVSPGVHWGPGGKFFNRAIRFRKNDPIVTLYQAAGYRVEPASEDPTGTVVIFFPVKSEARRSEKDVSLLEKADLAALAQQKWSDNAVSVTLTFDPKNEGDVVGTVLSEYAGRLKTASFLPQGNFVYPQMPYTQITEEEYESASAKTIPAYLDAIYDGDMEAIEAIGEAYCSTDACEVSEIALNSELSEV